jgi:hypothetical protein
MNNKDEKGKKGQKSISRKARVLPQGVRWLTFPLRTGRCTGVVESRPTKIAEVHVVGF